MTEREWVGLALWVLLFYPIWSPRCRRIRAREREVSRNEAFREAEREARGPAWEQDHVWPEVFEEDDL